MPARFAFSLIALLSFGALVAAGYLQHAMGQRPCPLCIAQRYAFIAITLLAVAGAFLSGQTLPRRIAAISTLLSTGAGLVFAVWMVFFTSTTAGCGADKVGDFVNGLPTAEWLPQYFFANGGCTDVYPPLFGLSVPIWALILFSVIESLAIIALLGDRKTTLQERWPEGHHYNK
jgi:protein dithiol:quinone oxidoreductase